jgi:hypothetical protein
MTQNESTHAVRDPWRSSLRASRERRAAARRAHRWSLRRRGVSACLIATMALGGGVALAGNGGTGTSSGDTASAGAQTLKPGARGAAVKRLQKKLGLRPDGVYGSATKRAVKKFQKRAGLKADGVAGPATLQRLGVKVRPQDTEQQQPQDEGSSVQVPAKLQRIAQCESGGDPTAVSADGTYRGKYQFDMSTWESMGGSGDPAKAPESTQDRLAVKLYNARGSAPWGRCANA